MLPANVGVTNPTEMQNQQRDLALAISQIKLGNIGVVSSTSMLTVIPSANGQRSKGQEEALRYLPIAAMPTKPSNITITNYNSNINNNINNNAAAIKTKLTPINIVQKKMSGNTKNISGTPPLIQLTTANPNANANSLLSILKPKTNINPTNGSSNSSNINSVNFHSKSQSQPQSHLHPAQSQSQTHPHPQSQLPSKSQSVLIRPAIPVQQQNGAAVYNTNSSSSSNNNNYSKGAAAAITLVAPKATTGGHKSAAAAVNPSTGQISLLSKPRTPVILSKEDVEKIRNSGALILTKALKCNSNNNNNPRPAHEIAGQKVATVIATTTTTASKPNPTPRPTSMPMPMAMMTTNTNVLPELKINALPAAVSLNGSKIMKVQGGTLAVVMPALSPAPPAAVNSPQSSSPKLQRSKSLAGNNENDDTDTNIHSNSTERRHSVAIMSKEVDVVEQTKTIETITIDDDDSEEEEELQREQEQEHEQHVKEQEVVKQVLQQTQLPQEQQHQELQMPSTQTSRKNSTASHSSISSVTSVASAASVASVASVASRSSSSSLEMIIMPTIKPEPQHPQVKQEDQQADQTPKISIVKAESLSVSKEEFERSLQCTEQVDQTSPPFTSKSTVSKINQTSSGTITLTPISRLQQNGVNHTSGAGSTLNNLKRIMQLNFGMLGWREQQHGTLENSTMRFGLNRYNLLQLSERCDRRKAPANYFERPLLDRPVRRPNSSSHPLLYLCSRCNCHGPASDFLAPRFCSIHCVRRAMKRRQANAPSESKMSRQDAKTSNGHATQQQKQQEQQQQKPQQHKQQQHQRESEREKEMELERDKERKRERERARERERKNMTTKRAFRWTEYLKIKGQGTAAPIHLFLNPFPISPNCFERGMKLEAIDPENCSLFCVCTIVEVRGYRLKLNFDGYASMYDFWVNADSMDIFPPGWCERTSRILQAPKGYCPDRFTWYRYLVKTNAKAAPIALFTHLNGPSDTRVNGFKVGMHLEAEDLNDTGKICVATVADKLDERIRVHFDGWDDCYDFWVHVNSPYIHPCSWHEGRQQLIVPPDYQNAVFNWADYIAEAGGVAAPVKLFAPREPMEFQARMKLEVVDQRNPCLIRPATVVTRKGYRVQLHMDCWPSEYYFWLEDDSPDLHPIGWCEATSHELETPPGFLQRPSPLPCDVEGCRGFGNAKRFNLNVHALRDCCPYAPENWRQWRAKTVKPPRVAPEHIKQTRTPKPPPVKKSSSLFLSGLSNTKPATEKVKPHAKKEKPRLILGSQPKPKLKREITKPAPVQIKQEEKQQAPKTVQRETATVNPLCLSIAKPIVKDYGPQYTRNYRLWQKNGNFDMSQIKVNPLYWTNWDVFKFVERALGSTDIAQMLFDEEIDGRALLMMERKDLDTYFELKMGPTVKLFSLIINLRIAVACKFKTTKTRLNFKRIPKSMPIKEETSSEKHELINEKLKSKLDTRSRSNRSSKSFEQEELKANAESDEYDSELDQDEITDEEDVILDSEDFLSVKPSIATTMDKDSDVVMTALDVLPSSVATIS